MAIEFLGAVLSAVGALMAFTHGALKTEELAMKQLFFGFLLLLAGLFFMFYKPA